MYASINCFFHWLYGTLLEQKVVRRTSICNSSHKSCLFRVLHSLLKIMDQWFFPHIESTKHFLIFLAMWRRRKNGLWIILIPNKFIRWTKSSIKWIGTAPSLAHDGVWTHRVSSLLCCTGATGCGLVVRSNIRRDLRKFKWQAELSTNQVTTAKKTNSVKHFSMHFWNTLVYRRLCVLLLASAAIGDWKTVQFEFVA